VKNWVSQLGDSGEDLNATYVGRLRDWYELILHMLNTLITFPDLCLRV
jgi:hypothetical protein